MQAKTEPLESLGNSLRRFSNAMGNDFSKFGCRAVYCNGELRSSHSVAADSKVFSCLHVIGTACNDHTLEAFRYHPMGHKTASSTLLSSTELIGEVCAAPLVATKQWSYYIASVILNFDNHFLYQGG
jgi:hypothetical protein